MKATASRRVPGRATHTLSIEPSVFDRDTFGDLAVNRIVCSCGYSAEFFDAARAAHVARAHLAV